MERRKTIFEVVEERIAGFLSHRLRAGMAEAVVVDDAGGMVRQIRLLDSGRTDTHPAAMELLWPPSDEEIANDPWFRGRVLCPFNDRIPGGRYRWAGQTLQLPINSPEDGSAIHGLLYSRSLNTVMADRITLDSDGQAAARLRLRTRWTHTEHSGYPFDLTVDLDYLLTETVFSFEISAANTGRFPAPIAFGWHPYFTLGGPIDELALRADCREFVPVDTQLMPTGAARPVEGSSVDFRRGRRIGKEVIDLAVTAPTDGSILLSSPRGGIRIELSIDTFKYLQVFTHPTRSSIAIEPITAATNAFNVPELGLRVLEPGERLIGKTNISYFAGVE